MFSQLLWAALLMTQAVDVTDRAVRTMLLDEARAPVVAELGKPVLFRVRSLKRQGGWAFLYADMEDRGGRPLSYVGTSKADAAQRGFVSRGYAALLRQHERGWRVIAHAIGPTDVAWEGWSSRYGAPPEVFATQ